MFGWKPSGPRYKIGLLLPAVGVLGSVFWNDMRLWIAVPTNVFCGFLLPVAYIGFIRLHRSREYLGSDLPSGWKGRLWTLGMVISTGVLIGFLTWFAWNNIPGWLEQVRS
jgi:manganese transport protein